MKAMPNPEPLRVQPAPPRPPSARSARRLAERGGGWFSWPFTRTMSIDAAAKARLTEFLDELRDHQFQFSGYAKVDINTRGYTGDAPLKIAVVQDDVQIVTDLLEAGADPNLVGEDECTPLYHAASHGHCEIIRLLLAHGASATMDSDRGTPAHLARRHPEAYALFASEASAQASPANQTPHAPSANLGRPWRLPPVLPSGFNKHRHNGRS